MTAEPGLDLLSREELVNRARELGARKPEVMTRVELRDEIVRLSESDPLARRRSRGWLGVARDLVASVMDAGLNMPGAAAAIRGESRPAEETTGPPPVATLTLAEIYLAQGHIERALGVLDEVLAEEPEHPAARTLRERILRERERGPRRGVVQDAEVVDEPPVPPPPAPAPFVVPAPVVLAEPLVQLPDPPLAAPVVVVDEAPMEPSAFSETPIVATVPNIAISEPPIALAEPPIVISELPVPPPSDPAPASPDSFIEPGPEAMMPSVRAPFERPRELPVSEPPSSIPAPSSTPSDPAPDAVRVPEIMTVPEHSPPTLAAPARESAPVVAVPVAPPACALAQGASAVEGYYSLPASITSAVLRVAWFVPRREGPSQGSVDVPLDPARGRVTLPDLDRSATIRAALGVDSGGSFQPLAVAWVYRVADGRVSVEFAPPGAEPTALRAQLGRPASDLAV